MLVAKSISAAKTKCRDLLMRFRKPAGLNAEGNGMPDDDQLQPHDNCKIAPKEQIAATTEESELSPQLVDKRLQRRQKEKQ